MQVSAPPLSWPLHSVRLLAALGSPDGFTDAMQNVEALQRASPIILSDMEHNLEALSIKTVTTWEIQWN